MKSINTIKFYRYTVSLIISFLLVSCGDPVWDISSSSPNDDFDKDGDKITDDTELNQTNIDLYNFNWELTNSDPSIAYGKPNSGSLTWGLNLKDRGYNYVHVSPDGVDIDDWGTGKLIYVMTHAAHHLLNYAEEYYQYGVETPEETTNGPTYSDFSGPLQIGDMSKQYGGYFSPHGSHQNGLDFDGRYVRVDRELNPLDIAWNSSDYDEDATKNMFSAYKDVYSDIQYIFVDTEALGFDLLVNNVSIFYDEEGHSNHYHLRIKCPSGQCQ